MKIKREQLRQIILEEAVDVDTDADTDTGAAGVGRRESRRERRRARRQVVQEKVRGLWNSEALQTLLDATSALGAVGSLSPRLQKVAIGTSLMSLAYSSGLGRDEDVEVNRWELASEIAVALAALAQSGAITIPTELTGMVNSFANTAAAGAGADILSSLGDLRGGDSLERVVCSGGRDNMVLVLQTVIDDPDSNDAQKSMAQEQIDQLNAVDATQCRQSESLKITRRQLRQIIKEELSLINEQASQGKQALDRLLYLRHEHQGEFALLDRLGEEGYRSVIQIRDEIEANPSSEDYSDYKSFFGRVKQQYGLFPQTIRNLWDERHETPDIEELKTLKAEYDDLSSQFESRGATSMTDSMYGRKRTEVVHTPSGEVVDTGVNKPGSLGS